MQQLKSLFLLGFLMSTSYQFAQYTDIINSNRPGKSMSAYSVGQTVIQAEGGFFGVRENNNLTDYDAKGFGSELSVRYGAFFEQFELMLDLQYQKDCYSTPQIDAAISGFRQSTIGAKYLVYDPFKNLREDKPNLYSWKANHSNKFDWKQLIPAVAIYGGFNIRLGNNPFFADDSSFSPKGMIITQNHFGTHWVFVNNFILDRITSKAASLGLVSSLTRGFNMRWSGLLEFQGTKSDFNSDYLLRLGAAYLIKENIQIDATISKNLKDNPSSIAGGFGLSWRFDANYEKVYLRSQKPDDEKDKKDKKAKKDKKKKRKDEVELEPNP